MPAYRLISTEGADLGSLRASVPAWSPGDLIQRGQGESLRVVRLVAAEPGDDVDGYLVVRVGAEATLGGEMVATPERIELLYWNGCPSYPEARELLQNVLDQHGVGTTVEIREVQSHQEAVELAFPGSPTIRIDGRDVDPVGAASRPALNCRIYRLPDGRVSPVPSREQLEEALR